jgi:hypothetical protein
MEEAHAVSSSGHVRSLPSTKFEQAYTATRSLLFYNLTATLPLIVIAGILLFTNIRGTSLVLLSVLGAITSAVGMGRLLYELTYDIVGDKTFRLPVWSVFYLIIYLISFFAFVIFAMTLRAPGYYFKGFSGSNAKIDFLDSLYMSLCGYIGLSPDGLEARTQSSRFLTAGGGLISMFINVVIITKFVNTF